MRLHLRDRSQEVKVSKYLPQLTTSEVSSELLCPVLGSLGQNRLCQSGASLMEGHRSGEGPEAYDI